MGRVPLVRHCIFRHICTARHGQAFSNAHLPRVTPAHRWLSVWLVVCGSVSLSVCLFVQGHCQLIARRTQQPRPRPILLPAGVQARCLASDRGRITAAQVEAAINPDDPHHPPTTLVCLENTCNKGGGSFYTLQEMTAVRQVCRRHGLRLHLDGARVGFIGWLNSDKIMYHPSVPLQSTGWG